jgi:hypothetical protein
MKMECRLKISMHVLEIEKVSELLKSATYLKAMEAKERRLEK